MQEFQVVNCFSCKIFQVHVKKKGKKWTCKLCGEKQSYIKIYFQGTSADCRKFVQKSNLDKGYKQEEIDKERKDFYTEEENNTSTSTAKTSTKWDKFIPDKNISSEQSSSEDNDIIIFDRKRPKRYHKRKLTNRSFKSKKLKEERSSDDSEYGGLSCDKDVYLN